MDDQKNLDYKKEIIEEISTNEDIVHNEVAPPKTEEEIAKIKQEILEAKEDANADFKKGQFLTAINKYTVCINQAEDIKFIDQLHILYCNKGLCFLKLVYIHIKKNDPDKAIDNFSKSLEYKGDNEKALYNRMMLLKAKGEYIDALSDFEKLQLINNKLTNYSFECELRNLAEKKKMQMQQEMLGQLKDVGNKFLGLFGLSTDNFKVQQGQGGGYNISFQQ